MEGIKEIWIGSETKSAIIGIPEEEKEINDNSDVIVTLKNGNRYIASFFTYRNIQWLKEKNQRSGECLNGKYFWASDLILIDKINRKEITEVIQNLIENDEFESVFKFIEEI
jgi:hypothetical protein